MYLSHLRVFVGPGVVRLADSRLFRVGCEILCDAFSSGGAGEVGRGIISGISAGYDVSWIMGSLGAAASWDGPEGDRGFVGWGGRLG